MFSKKLADEMHIAINRRVNEWKIEQRKRIKLKSRLLLTKVATNIAFAIYLYFGIITLSKSLTPALWPFSAIMIAMIYFYNNYFWPGMLLGTGAALFKGGYSLGAVFQLTGIFGFEVLLFLILANNIIKNLYCFDKITDFIKFVMVVSLAVAASGLLSFIVIFLDGKMTITFVSFIYKWWLSHNVAILGIMPICYFFGTGIKVNKARIKEYIFYTLLYVLVSFPMFLTNSFNVSLIFCSTSIALIAIISIRLNQVGVAISLLAGSILIIWADRFAKFELGSYATIAYFIQCIFGMGLATYLKQKADLINSRVVYE